MMKKNTLTKKKLEQIFHVKSFDSLDEHLNPEEWGRLKQPERDLLALLFIMYGEKLLKSNSPKALDLFRCAAIAAPLNDRLLIKQVMLLVDHSEEKSLEYASRLLSQLTTQHPTTFKLWYMWGHVLVRLSIIKQHDDLAHVALEKFKDAETFIHLADENELLEYYWHQGMCWFTLGKFSEESSDYSKALTLFKMAEEKGKSAPSFWNDYGNLISEISFLHSRTDMFHEAIKKYQRCIDIDPLFYECWYNLACSNQLLYFLSMRESYFQESSRCFIEASKLNPEDASLLFKWGDLLLQSGKITSRLDRIQTSIELYDIAHHLDPQCDPVLTRMAEAQILCGIGEEDYNLLKQAEKTVLKSLEINPNRTESWYVYGLCNNAQGEYFNDEAYFKQAIQKFQHGLAINPKDDFLWYGLAVANYEIGERTDDSSCIEKSLQFYSRVAEFGNQLSPQFWNDWGVALLKYGELKANIEPIKASIEKFQIAINYGPDAIQNEKFNIEFLFNYSYALDMIGTLSGDLDCFDEALTVLSKIQEYQPNDPAVHLHFAMVLTHVADITSEVECYKKAYEHFQIYLTQENEDEVAWNDWGVCLASLGELMIDPGCPSISQQLFHEAEQKFHHAVALGNVYALYNLAGLNSLMNNIEVSMHYLERAQLANALPPIDDLLHDEWLDNLRNTPCFADFITHIQRET